MGETEGVDGGVGLRGATVGDDGRAVEAGVGVVFPPPQATATAMATAMSTTSQPTRNDFLPISYLH